MTTIAEGPTALNRPRDYKPAPGRVTVLREKVERHYVKDEGVDIAKPVLYAEAEEVFTIFAVVARVGDQLPGGVRVWVKPGDVVTIQPSMFDEVPLSPTMSVWCGPLGSISGVFVEPEEVETGG